MSSSSHVSPSGSRMLRWFHWCVCTSLMSVATVAVESRRLGVKCHSIAMNWDSVTFPNLYIKYAFSCLGGITGTRLHGKKIMIHPRLSERCTPRIPVIHRLCCALSAWCRICCSWWIGRRIGRTIWWPLARLWWFGCLLCNIDY